MEFVYLLILLPSFLLLLRLARRSVSSTKKVVPPGPWELPIIGSLHHLAGKLPHHSLRDLSERYGQLMLLRFGEVPTLVVSSPEAAREIMKTHDIAFADRPAILAVQIMSYGNKGIIFAPYGNYWRELRKLSVLELLSAKRVLSFRSIREEEVHNLVRSVPDASVVNLSSKLFVLMNDITIRSIVGDKCKRQDIFLDALNKSIEAAGSFNMADLFPSSTLARLFCGTATKLKKRHQQVDAILEDIIREHTEMIGHKERGSEEDLLDVLLRVGDQEGSLLQFPLPIESIKALILDLFGAGSETSSTTVGWAMSELVRNPRAMKKAQSEAREVFEEKGKVTEADLKELNYLKAVVKETLRLHPPVPLLLPRECRETCRVLGYEIPEKARVVVNVWAIGRDPQIWDDAEEFKPERFDESNTTVDFKGTDFEYLPFGAGRRMCPGMSYGIANVEIALAALLFHFDWQIPNGAKPGELDMTEAFGLTARRKSDLHLLAIPRR